VFSEQYKTQDRHRLYTAKKNIQKRVVDSTDMTFDTALSKWRRINVNCCVCSFGRTSRDRYTWSAVATVHQFLDTRQGAAAQRQQTTNQSASSKQRLRCSSSRAWLWKFNKIDEMYIIINSTSHASPAWCFITTPHRQAVLATAMDRLKAVLSITG